MNSNTLTLRQRILRAGSWGLAGHSLAQAIRLGSNLIMTRILAPEMFGIMAIAAMVEMVVYMFSDIGLPQNIVQSRRGDDPLFLDTAWAVQILRGALLWAVMVTVSLGIFLASHGGLIPANSVYAAPQLPWVIAALSFSSAIIGFQSTGMATAERHLNQKRLVQISLTSQVIGLAVMVTVGLSYRSVWALVAGNLSSAFTTAALSHLWIAGHRNRWRIDKTALKELRGFGKWVFISSSAGVLAANGDRMLLGAIVSPAELGLYAIAVLMTGAIEVVLGRLLASVSLPALAEVARNNPERLCDVYYKMRLPSDLVLLFVSGALFAAGQLIIDVLYDHRYAASGGILQILALSLFTTRFLMAYQIYLALGLPRYVAMLNIVRCISLYAVVPGLYVVAGSHAAIWGVALHGLATLPLIFYFNARHGLIRIRNELVVLLALPLGMAFGHAILFLRG